MNILLTGGRDAFSPFVSGQRSELFVTVDAISNNTLMSFYEENKVLIDTTNNNLDPNPKVTLKYETGWEKVLQCN